MGQGWGSLRTRLVEAGTRVGEPENEASGGWDKDGGA